MRTESARSLQGLGFDVFATLVEASIDGIVVLDSERRYVHANPAACELLGHPLATLIGRDLLMNLSAEERRPVRQRFTDGFMGAPGPWPTEVRRPDGRAVEVQCVATVLDLPDQRLVAVVIRDVSELHRQTRMAAARLLAAASERVAHEERQRLARELHDSVSQALYGIGLAARTARALLERDPARAAEPVNYITRLAEAGLAEMRALIFELRPESLEAEGLVVALDKQVGAIRARHGIAAEILAHGEPDVPIDVKHALYRIAQEAMQNTIKHAAAGRIGVSLEARGDAVVLQVEDDGVGFDPAGSFPGHLGLRSMRERAMVVRGELELVSVHGHGTRVTVRVPAIARTPGR